MITHSELEKLLRAVDLDVGTSNADEYDDRLSVLVDGQPLSPDDMAYLAQHSECRGIWRLAREGLREFRESTDPSHPRITRLKPPRKAPSTAAALGFFFLAACAFAGGTWYLLSEPEDIENTQHRPLGTLEQTGSELPDIQGYEPTSDALVQRVNTEAEKQQSEIPTIPKTSEEGRQRSDATVGQHQNAGPDILDRNTVSTQPIKPRPDQAMANDRANAVGSKDNEVKAFTPTDSQTEKKTLRPRKTTNRLQTKGLRPRLQREALQTREQTKFSRFAVDAPSRGFGQLRLNARPAAKVYIDGTFRGWTPIIDLRLQAGPHDVRLVYEHADAEHAEERFRVLIQADQTWATVRNNRQRSGQETPPPESKSDD